MGSEMCIRDSVNSVPSARRQQRISGRRNENKTKMLRGWCSWRVHPELGLLIMFAQGTRRGPAGSFFSRFFTTHFELRAVDSSVLCHLSQETCSSSSSVPITKFRPSPLDKPPPGSRLRVVFLVSCVMNIYLLIDRSVHLSPGLTVAVAVASSAIPPLYLSLIHI